MTDRKRPRMFMGLIAAVGALFGDRGASRPRNHQPSWYEKWRNPEPTGKSRAGSRTRSPKWYQRRKARWRMAQNSRRGNRS